MNINPSPLTMDSIARSAAESIAPELYPLHAWIPQLGFQGKVLQDVVGTSHMAIASYGSYAGDRYNFTGVGDQLVAANALCDFSGNKYTVFVKAAIGPCGTVAGSPMFYGPMLFNNYSPNIEIQLADGRESDAQYVYIGNQSIVYLTAPLFDYTIRTYAFVSTGTKVLFYVNNKLAASANSASDSFPTGAKTIRLGCWSNISEVRWSFIGGLYYQSVYNYALNASQIADLSADVMKPFRRTKSIFYSLPATTGFNAGIYRSRDFPRL